MIALCTGTPEFTTGDEQTIVTFPSGEGEAVRVALTRNQLCQLMQQSRWAMNEAFEAPQPEVSGPVLIRKGGRT